MTQPKRCKHKNAHTCTRSHTHSHTNTPNKNSLREVLLSRFIIPSKFGKSHHYPSFSFRLATWLPFTADTLSHITPHICCWPACHASVSVQKHTNRSQCGSGRSQNTEVFSFLFITWLSALH